MADELNPNSEQQDPQATDVAGLTDQAAESIDQPDQTAASPDSIIADSGQPIDQQPPGDTADAGAMAEQALAGAAQAADTMDQTSGDDQPVDGPNVDLPNFQQVLEDVQASGINLLHDVELNVKIELGRTHMLVEDVLRLNEGSVVELNKLAGDPVDVLVNERLVARGEVLVLNDNFCVRVNEVISDLDEEVGNASDKAAEDQPDKSDKSGQPDVPSTEQKA